MIRRLRVLRWTGTDPYENLALEEHLRRRAEEGTAVLYLWQNRPRAARSASTSRVPWWQQRP